MMSINIKKWLITFIAMAFTTHAAYAEEIIIGHVSKITTKEIIINGNKYPLLNGSSEDLNARPGTVTECREKFRMTCGTVAAIGYIDKAKVTIRNGYAIQIVILELQQ